MSTTDYNKIITTFNSVTSDYTFIPDQNNLICIDTSNNRIGINTVNPKEAIDVSGGTIKAQNMEILGSTLLNDISVNNNLDISNNLQVNGKLNINNDIISNIIYCNKIISTNDNDTYIEFKPRNGSDRYSIFVKGNDGSTQYKDDWLHIYESFQTHWISDDRLKHNEQNISNSLSIIRKLQPQIYDMTKEFYDENYTGTISGEYNHMAGFIAQEIRAIEEISYCCIGEEYDASNNPIALAIDYNSIFTHGIEAIKELDLLVESQKQEIILLKQENLNIKTALNELLLAAGKNTL
tara:strand:+ start:16252 stop:17133 length:882 start_codon:yes stop_codon:yes gene_type:complete